LKTLDACRTTAGSRFSARTGRSGSAEAIAPSRSSRGPPCKGWPFASALRSRMYSSAARPATDCSPLALGMPALLRPAATNVGPGASCRARRSSNGGKRASQRKSSTR
jgi:hypothetical protein